MSYLQAIVIGLLQGVTELFPVSSLGHSVLVAGWLGWDNLAQRAVGQRVVLPGLPGRPPRRDRARPGRVLLARVGGHRRRVLHLAPDRRVETPAPAHGLAAHPRHHSRRPVRARLRAHAADAVRQPLAAAFFLTLNGLILLAGERLAPPPRHRKRRPGSTTAQCRSTPRRRTADGAIIGTSQIAAPFAGISRSGITMVTGLLRGSTTRTRPASRSCWPRRSSSPRASTSSPTWPARSVTASVARSSSAASAPERPPTSRSASSPGGSTPAPSPRSRSTASSPASSRSSTSPDPSLPPA